MKKGCREVILSILVTILAIGAYLYASVFADRKNIFLYEHLGAGPFDPMTTGRYWMFGFVVAGFICALLFFILSLLNINKKRAGLNVTKIITYTSIPLLVSVLLIVLSFGEPALTFSLSLSTAVTLIFGLVVGISFVNDLTTKWLITVKQMVIGVGLIPFAVLFRALELPGKGILSMNTAIKIPVATFVFGTIWVIVTKWIFRKQEIKNILVLREIAVMYCLGLPVIHFFVTVFERHPYITSSDNLFADNIWLRFINWLLIAVVIIGFNNGVSKQNEILTQP